MRLLSSDEIKIVSGGILTEEKKCDLAGCVGLLIGNAFGLIPAEIYIHPLSDSLSTISVLGLLGINQIFWSLNFGVVAYGVCQWNRQIMPFFKLEYILNEG